MTTSRVAAVVVAHDRADVLARTLAAIVAQSAAPETLLLIANQASAAVIAVMEDVAARHPDAEVLRLPVNSGAAGGFHAGLARAVERTGLDCAVCFDDDAEPLPGCLAALRDAAEHLPDLGCAGALAHDGGGALSWPLWLLGEPDPVTTVAAARERARAGGPLRAHGLSWHALLVPLDVVRRHGNVWAELFHQYEDAEFGLRLRAAGLHNYVVDTAECLHPAAPAAGAVRLLGYSLRITREPPAKEYLTVRNDLVVRHRYNGLRFWYGTLPLILLRGLLVALSGDLPRAQAVGGVYMRAILDAARGRLGPPPATLTDATPGR
jgi:rhamnopyranosyl-N-acetylglucosaminyl-diphospho-decaprenol beta-1,3/1,4-galactofuranosyltransferase